MELEKLPWHACAPWGGLWKDWVHCWLTGAGRRNVNCYCCQRCELEMIWNRQYKYNFTVDGCSVDTFAKEGQNSLLRAHISNIDHFKTDGMTFTEIQAVSQKYVWYFCLFVNFQRWRKKKTCVFAHTCMCMRTYLSVPLAKLVMKNLNKTLLHWMYICNRLIFGVKPVKVRHHSQLTLRNSKMTTVHMCSTLVWL